MHELNMLCVLDFYVHETYQRSGRGKILFEFMLAVSIFSHSFCQSCLCIPAQTSRQAEGVTPSNLAYDRPSPKLIGFLAKHYRLVDYRPQVAVLWLVFTV